MVEDNLTCCGKETEVTELYDTKKCPMCGNEGIPVNRITVEHLVQDIYQSEVKKDGFRICMDENCDVVYYNPEGKEIFSKKQINVPIWFKKDADPKYACYCSKITEEQVIDAVVRQGARTVKKVNILTGAMKNSSCLTKNPLGICCHKIIQDIIDKELAKNK